MDKKLVLVLEDEQSLAQVIQKKLELNNFEVISARSVQQGLHYLQEGNPIAAIWLDHYLIGKENGLDFVAMIKNKDQWKRLPIFVVSNTASSEKLASYVTLGVDKYYTKSDYRLDDIVQDLKAAIEGGH